jgi:hypothetical protein
MEQLELKDFFPTRKQTIIRKLLDWKIILEHYPNIEKTKAVLNKGNIEIDTKFEPYSTTAGSYKFVRGNISLRWDGIKQCANRSGIDPLKVICSVISHETIHYTLHKEQDFETCWKFDVIAGYMDWYIEDIHGGMPLTKE